MSVTSWFGAGVAALGLGVGLAVPSLARGQHFPGNDIVEQTADDVASAVKARRADRNPAPQQRQRTAFDADQHEFYKLVHTKLLPHFDMQEGCRSILADAWKKYSEEDRTRFVDAFYTFLLASFGDRLVYFKPKTLRVKPFEGDPTDPAHVHTILTMNDGTEVAVDFVMKKQSDGDWRVSDIVAEGASYDRMYRSQFRVEIATEGLESVIRWLETKASSCYSCHPAGIAASPRAAPPR
ncbi:MAG TPA: ABC transporter substrate-binding protein [Gammaproteobacteria bacterium]|nr:ABC transporter substrate-binding protein [Gammaproteobacteria bacterium]